MSKIIDSLKKVNNTQNSGKQPPAETKNIVADSGGSIISAAQSSQPEAPVSAPVSALKVQPPRKTDTFPVAEKTADTSFKNIRIIGLLIAAGFLLLLTVNVGLILLLKNYNRASTSNSNKLDRLEELLSKNFTNLSTRVKDQDTEIKKLNQSAKDTQEQVTQLDKDITAQRTAVDNLNKAKKTLFNKVSELEQGLEKLQNPAPPQPK